MDGFTGRREVVVMKIMIWMLLALTPAAAWSVYVFGIHALVRILTGTLSAVAAEAIFQKLTGQKITVKDGSAAITGTLMGMAVSISTPVYAVAFAAAFGIVAGKQLLGGLGKNLFNPMMFGRLFYLFVFPDSILPWRAPFTFEAVSGATPLEILRETGQTAGIPLSDMFLGLIPGAIGEVSTLALLIGFSILVYKKFVRWRIPAAAFSAVLVLAVISGQNPLYHFFAGSLMFGACFMATDPMTSPRFPKGQIFFGIGIGLIIMAMRWWGWQTPGEYEFTEGTTFAVLIMNLFTPYLNKKFKPVKK
ncbi:MAG: RnfABCDGE type electron transport complex subunit D [Spirochaetaceae bacterium]|nr:MAG: RnfABCDGE type electron transport complex subunit D [Spirochaetaceae bacterium]